MNNTLRSFAIIAFTCTAFTTRFLQATPPAGTQWALIPELSDEFNTQHSNPASDGIDNSKWWDFHPTWTGRLPSQYNSANTWVADGKLQMRSTAIVTDMNQVNDLQNDHWVDAPVIMSRAEAQPGDYYEASIKTAGLSMPSSWWFEQGSKSEIDVIENIGLPTANGLTHRESQMSYNTHFIDPGPLQSAGGDTQMFDDQEAPLLSRENFITYGVWWKSPTEIRYYFNGTEAAIVTPQGKFDEGLNMIFDMEVFSWVGYPTLASLNDPTKNTMQVDWVRGYRPIENLGPPRNLIDNPSFELSHDGQPNRPDFWVDCGNYNCGTATPFESRSNETAHSGDWSLKIDNTQPNSFSQYKEIRVRDNILSVLPGDTIHQEVWVKLTEELQNGNETFSLAIRLNGDSSQPHTGAGQAVLDDGTVIAQFNDPVSWAREINVNSTFGGQHLNEWIKIEYDLEIPATDNNGDPVHYISSLSYIDNKTSTTPNQGTLYIDDFSLVVLNGDQPGDFDQDHDTDGADFLRWQRGGPPSSLSSSNLMDWQNHYGTSTSTTDSTPVPEPAAATLFLFATICQCCRTKWRTPKS